ncbi:DUF7064 domain-containing protein [Patulibacter minatonensis]|uniref:DUF7064 domain-containing protein n=1 Tax=Patulibacter minatonensis TaxID=298163 RepID=UPI00047C1737|nr:hypothetical protein [Patulibacter minatonensis]
MPITPLDPSADRRHVLDPSRTDDREGVVWVVPLPEHELALVAYSWVTNQGTAGTLALAFGPRAGGILFERVDDIAVPDDQVFDDWQVGPLHFSMSTPDDPSQPSGASHVRYEGERLSMDFTFDVLHPPYSYAQHPEPFPDWYADDRLEQGGRAKGTAVIDGERIAFEGFAHRDHSWGVRTWEKCSHYKWFNFLADDTSIHVMDVQGLGHTDVRGYVHRDGDTAQIVESTFDYDLDPEDFFHRRLVVTVKDDSGRTTTARVTSSKAEARYPVSPTVQLLDIAGECEIEGREGVCYVEMGWGQQYVEVNSSADAPAVGAH